jgi:regulator of protease activity HflC (stomatin/prohibitin superfamily)
MKHLVIILMAVTLSSCAVIRPGEVGVRSTFGKLKGDVNEFMSQFVLYPEL